MKKIIFYFLAILLLTISLPKPSQATVFYAHNFNVGKTYLTFWENHGYYPRSMDFQYAYEIFAFEQARQDLVALKAIDDLPLLIELPSPIDASYPELSSVSAKDNCLLLSGEEGQWQQDLGNCYSIELTDSTYENTILAILDFQNLSENKAIVIDDFNQLKEKYKDEMVKYLNMENDFDIIWSPDGKYVTYISWQAGQNIVKIVRASDKKEIYSEKLSGYQNYRGLWSQDSRFLAYATGEGIKIFDLLADNIKTINFADLLGNSTMLVNLKYSDFNYMEPALLFQIEKNSFGELLVYNYDLIRNETTPTDNNNYELIGDENLMEANVLSVGITSPDSNNLAQINIENGLRKFKISEFNIVNNNLNQIPEIEKTINPEPIAEPEVQPAFIITDILPGNTELYIIGSALGLALILLVIVLIKLFKV